MEARGIGSDMKEFITHQKQVFESPFFILIYTHIMMKAQYFLLMIND